MEPKDKLLGYGMLVWCLALPPFFYLMSYLLFTAPYAFTLESLIMDYAIGGVATFIVLLCVTFSQLTHRDVMKLAAVAFTIGAIVGSGLAVLINASTPPSGIEAACVSIGTSSQTHLVINGSHTSTMITTITHTVSSNAFYWFGKWSC